MSVLRLNLAKIVLAVFLLYKNLMKYSNHKVILIFVHFMI